MSRRMLIMGVGAVVALAIAPSAASADTATPSCNGGSCTPASTWFNADVALHWTFNPDPPTASSGCEDKTISTEGDNLVTCSATWAPPDPPPTLTPFPVHVKIDKTAPTVTGATPSGATANAAGWFSSPVSFTFEGSDLLSLVSSCQTVGPYGGPNSAAASVSGTCTDNAGNTSALSPHTFKYDATSPVIASVSASRPPDGGGWYNHPLSVSATSSTAGPSGITCGPVAYGGPDGAAIPVTAGCATGAGLSASKALAINYDATAPTVTGAAADRPPDHGGYYNHPVTFTFTGADATSGIQRCDRVTYSGPDDSTAHVTGSCHDNAGNINIRSFEFKYDGTRPRTPKVVATPGSKRVDLSWTGTDATSFVVTRSVMGSSAGAVTAYSGPNTNFVDTKVKNGVRYIYTVTGSDSAGNTSSASTRAIPTASSLRPFAGTAVGSAPLLTWKKVKRARYYNIQLWRGGKKVLTAWPARASFQVPQRWRFKGRRYSISSGHYRWWVWPGYGPRSAHRYGKPLGTSSFRLRS